ncbi:hypothetical protein [Thermogutta sp.]|uniref:WD40/YVTN/BNR-like repeat-containing protein n=1 Tax=Thermogutta sp. TaxID=1962930 RepID=UPI00321F984F
MDRYFSKGEASIFVQIDPDSAYELLTCASAGNIVIPEGDVTVVRVPDPVFPGRWRRVALVQAEGDAPTVTITRPLSKIRDVLSQCPFSIRLNFACSGERTVTNYDSAIVLHGARVTSRTFNEPAPLTPSAETITVDLEISAAFAMMWDRLVRQSRTGITSTTPVVGVFALPAECAGRCSAGRDTMSVLYAVNGTENLHHSDDGGLNWNSVSVATDAELKAVTATEDRVIVGGSLDTDGIIAYSDDLVTWTVVSLPGAPVNAIARDDAGRYYAATGSGIYLSTNRGTTWSRVAITANPLNDIVSDGSTVYAVGNVGTFAYGRGTEWSVLASGISGNFATCDVNEGGRVVCITSTGGVYRYYNGVFSDAGSVGGAVNKMRFALGTIGIAVGTATYITEDGGVSWRRFDSVAANSVFSSVSGYQPRWMIGGANGSISIIL